MALEEAGPDTEPVLLGAAVKTVRCKKRVKKTSPLPTVSEKISYLLSPYLLVQPSEELKLSSRLLVHQLLHLPLHRGDLVLPFSYDRLHLLDLFLIVVLLRRLVASSLAVLLPAAVAFLEFSLAECVQVSLGVQDRRSFALELSVPVDTDALQRLRDVRARRC
jgi:hypothetical protein